MFPSPQPLAFPPLPSLSPNGKAGPKLRVARVKGGKGKREREEAGRKGESGRVSVEATVPSAQPSGRTDGRACEEPFSWAIRARGPEVSYRVRGSRKGLLLQGSYELTFY